VAVVETRSGRVGGLEEAGIHAFRGIPYARPPLAGLRLRPPQRELPWPGVRDARSAGPASLQNGSMLGALLGLPPAEHHEDCLSLNVHTPAPDGERRPVMVWIHGGGFVFGSGAQTVYESAELVRRGDVVLVTLNYRLGALGWLALPALGHEEGGVVGNLGLLDQIAALEWVQECIAGFGGDPARVTVFGESAGAMSVGALLGAPRAAGLFRRAILQSGACHNASDRETAARVAHVLMKELGLEPEDVASLRSLPADRILEAQARTILQMAPEVRGLPFQPTVDGAVLPERPLDAVAAGASDAVELLVGTNADEWKLFGLSDAKARSLDERALLRRLERSAPGRAADGRPHAERALHTYREARRSAGLPAEPPDIWFAAEGDRFFGVPALRLAEQRRDAVAGTWRYLFTWQSPAMGGALGACHALELPFVFGTTDRLPALRGFVGEGPEVGQLSRRMQDAWLAFAHDGRPSTPALGEWPGFEPVHAPTMLLGRECGVADAPHGRELGFWSDLL